MLFFLGTDSAKKGRSVKLDSAKKITLANKTDPLVIDIDKGRKDDLIFDSNDNDKRWWAIFTWYLMTFTRPQSHQ